MKVAIYKQNSPMKLILLLFTLAALACATVRAQQSVEILSYTGTTWRYHTNNADQGTAWRAANFNDSAAPWLSGRGLFGWEPNNPQNYAPGFNTTFPAYTPAILTYYFRARYTNTTPATALVATNLVDDGLVIYINGVEAGRLRVPANQDWQTAANAGPTNEGQDDPIVMNPDLLRYGTNVIAVEVHNVAASSDIVFGMSLVATYPALTPMSVTSQPQDKTVIVRRSYTLTVGLSGGPGYYQWQANNGAGAYTNIPGATFATFTNVASVLGTNAYRAYTYNGSQSVTSSAAVVTVVPDTFGPLMLSANVLEEATRTNRIQITWDEKLLDSTVLPPQGLTNFRVVLYPSNIIVGISNLQYSPGTFPNPGIPPTTTLGMSNANWHIRSNYCVIVNNVRDASNNVVAPNSVICVSWPVTTNVFTLDSQAWDYHANYLNDLNDRLIDIYTQNWIATNYDLTTAGWGGPASGLHLFDNIQTNQSCFNPLSTNAISYQEQPTLFRATFMWAPNVATNVDLRFYYAADDAIAVFFNGEFLFKDASFPAGPITAGTRASAGTEGNCKTNIIRNMAMLRGANYLAVAIAQLDSVPADTIFGMQLDAVSYRTSPLPTNAAPVLAIRKVAPDVVRITWPTNAYSYALEYNTTDNTIRRGTTMVTNVFAGPWLEVQPLMANPYLTNPPSDTHRIYRLHKVPHGVP